MWPLSLVIKHIEGKRNRIVDGLSRTIFQSLDCEDSAHIQGAIQKFLENKWIWKDKANGFEEFLDSLPKED
jgi:hypothetical protein